MALRQKVSTTDRTLRGSRGHRILVQIEQLVDAQQEDIGPAGDRPPLLEFSSHHAHKGFQDPEALGAAEAEVLTVCRSPLDLPSQRVEHFSARSAKVRVE